jgi:hypothetical protein
MLPAGDADTPGISAAIGSDALRVPHWMRALLGTALALALWSSPAAALAGEVVPDAGDGSLVFGFTVTELALAVAVGAGVGAAGAVASSNLIAGASVGFGTLAAIYVAHLAVEAAVVGGAYYWSPWWPWGSEPQSPASRTMVIRDAE